jgi:excisionase family DNA binding protein
MTRLLKLSDAAELLSVSPRTLERWADKGMITITRLPNKAKRVSEEEIVAFIRNLNPLMPSVSSTTASDLARHGLSA